MEDIKPIDKFTLDKYVREEDDLLEYVEMLGCKCHPDYDFIRVKKEIEDRTETNETEVATEQQATEQQAAAAAEEEEEEEEEEEALGIGLADWVWLSGRLVCGCWSEL